MEFPLGLKVPHLLQPYIAAFTKADPEAVAGCFAEEATLHLPDTAEPLVGRGAIQRHYEAFFHETPELVLHRVRYFQAPEEMVSISELTMAIPLLGPGRYLAATAQVYRFTPDGQIASVRTFVDTSGAVRMQQTP